jgi:acyl-CoA dehydrogenase
MDFTPNPEHAKLREAVAELCSEFPGEYWRELDQRRGYPDAFVKAMTGAGYLGALIPEEYGGLGLGVTEASIILEEVNHSGGNSGAAHAQLYIMGALLKHGSEEQKQQYLPAIASGELRLQTFGVTERESGSDTTSLRTTAVRQGDRYIVNGQKTWIGRALHSDLMLLLARTTPVEEVESRTHGLSIFMVDLREGQANGQIEIKPLDTMRNHHTTEITMRDLEVPAGNLVGTEGMGFRHIIDGWNAERILIAAEAIGNGYWFVERSSAHATTREVFGRPIGMNQGVQFPIAQAYADLTAADLLRYKAAWLFDTGQRCGAEANMCKLLASKAAWDAANAALDTHGGSGFGVDYDVERKFRETRLFTVAPINNNLVLAFVGQHVLGMPRSY